MLLGNEIVTFDRDIRGNIVNGKNDAANMFQADTITSDGWLQIDLGQMYAIESINVKGVAGSPYHPPAYTNNLAIFTSSTKIMFSNTDRKTIAELEADITVNKIGVTSGLSADAYRKHWR